MLIVNMTTYLVEQYYAILLHVRMYKIVGNCDKNRLGLEILPITSTLSHIQ